MLKIIVPEQHYEYFDEATGTFIYRDLDRDVVLELEHSLISVRKWEAKTHKPFIKTEKKTTEELVLYIKCMTLNKVRDEKVYEFLTKDNVKEIEDYMNDPMTATWFRKSASNQVGNSREIVTAEIIYYWMIALGIPIEFERWHLSRLITLIKVVSIKSKGNEKMNKRDAARERAALNAKRRAMYNTTG